MKSYHNFLGLSIINYHHLHNTDRKMKSLFIDTCMKHALPHGLIHPDRASIEL